MVEKWQKEVNETKFLDNLFTHQSLEFSKVIMWNEKRRKRVQRRTKYKWRLGGGWATDKFVSSNPPPASLTTRTYSSVMPFHLRQTITLCYGYMTSAKWTTSSKRFLIINKRYDTYYNQFLHRSLLTEFSKSKLIGSSAETAIEKVEMLIVDWSFAFLKRPSLIHFQVQPKCNT